MFHFRTKKQTVSLPTERSTILNAPKLYTPWQPKNVSCSFYFTKALFRFGSESYPTSLLGRIVVIKEYVHVYCFFKTNGAGFLVIYRSRPSWIISNYLLSFLSRNTWTTKQQWKLKLLPIRRLFKSKKLLLFLRGATSLHLHKRRPYHYKETDSKITCYKHKPLPRPYERLLSLQPCLRPDIIRN